MTKSNDVDRAPVHDVVLLPCPFCGGEACWVLNHHMLPEYQVTCIRCHADAGTWDDSVGMAIDRWNTRCVDGHVVTFHREKAGVIAPTEVWVVVAEGYMYGPHERWDDVEYAVRDEWKDDRHMVG